MATSKKKGGPAGYVFDCDSEPIPPGTKAGKRVRMIDGERPAYSWKLWSIFGAVVIIALVLGIFIGRSF